MRQVTLRDTEVQGIAAISEFVAVAVRERNHDGGQLVELQRRAWELGRITLPRDVLGVPYLVEKTVNRFIVALMNNQYSPSTLQTEMLGGYSDDTLRLEVLQLYGDVGLVERSLHIGAERDEELRLLCQLLLLTATPGDSSKTIKDRLRTGRLGYVSLAELVLAGDALCDLAAMDPSLIRVRRGLESCVELAKQSELSWRDTLLYIAGTMRRAAGVAGNGVTSARVEPAHR